LCLLIALWVNFSDAPEDSQDADARILDLQHTNEMASDAEIQDPQSIPEEAPRQISRTNRIILQVLDGLQEERFEGKYSLK